MPNPENNTAPVDGDTNDANDSTPTPPDPQTPAGSVGTKVEGEAKTEEKPQSGQDSKVEDLPARIADLERRLQATSDESKSKRQANADLRKQLADAQKGLQERESELAKMRREVVLAPYEGSLDDDVKTVLDKIDDLDALAVAARRLSAPVEVKSPGLFVPQEGRPVQPAKNDMSEMLSSLFHPKQ